MSDKKVAVAQDEACLVARDYIDSVVGSPNDRVGFSQTRFLMEALSKRCIAESRRNREDRYDLENRLNVAWDIIREVWYAAAPDYANNRLINLDWTTDDEESDRIADAKHVIWRRRDPHRSYEEGYNSDQYTNFSIESFHQTIATYLEGPWLRNPHLDWIILDMSVSQKICEFGEAIKREGLPGMRGLFFNNYSTYHSCKGHFDQMSRQLTRDLPRRIAFTLLSVILAPVAAIWAAFYFGYELTGFLVGGLYVIIILTYFATKLVRLSQRLLGKPDPRLKPLVLWREMYEVWRRLAGPVVHSGRVREAMVRSTEHGAEWDAPTWSIIDRVISLDPAVWVVRPNEG